MGRPATTWTHVSRAIGHATGSPVGRCMGMPIIHVVARALRGHKPLLEPRAAWWLMWRLRIAFPEALSACVLPDHFHLITCTPDPPRARGRLSKILAVLTVRAGMRHLFEPVPEPRVVPPGGHLERSVRYVHLNPCRAGLVSDPLSWPWSTHRGLIGAELDPWVTTEALAGALGRPARGLAEWLHAYVSGDSTVAVEGTEFPTPALPTDVPGALLGTVRVAALSATPWSPGWRRRKLVVELARHQGWSDADLIARTAGFCARSARRCRTAARDRVAERAAALCLGDPRLLLPEAWLRPLGPVARWPGASASGTLAGRAFA